MADQNDAPRGDHSLAELRAMMAGEQAPDTSKAEPETETPAKPDEESGDKTEPESGTDNAEEKGKEGKDRERGADGKFKGKSKDDDEPGEVPAGVQKRIDKAVRAQREAERERDELKAKLAGGNQESRPARENAPPAEPAKKPESKNFDSYEAYIEALTDWKLTESRKADQARVDTEKRSQAEKATLTAHQARVAKAIEKHPDYSDVMDGVKDLPISREMHSAIVERELGPEVAYFLAKNPDEAKRIFALPSSQHAVEMGKIESKLEASTETKPADKKEKPLPKPAKNVGGGSGAKQPSLDDPDISMDTFKRLVQAGLKKSA